MIRSCQSSCWIVTQILYAFDAGAAVKKRSSVEVSVWWDRHRFSCRELGGTWKREEAMWCTLSLSVR